MNFFGAFFIVSALIGSVYSDSCVQCDSADDLNCVTSPNRFLAKSCSKSDSKCYVRILDGRTVRGCVSDLDPQVAQNCNSDCAICSYQEGCNSQIFPSHRFQCVQCKGPLNSTCAVDAFGTATVCPLHMLGDRCIIRKSVKKDELLRGCMSSVGDLCKDQSQCYICDGHGCNFKSANDPEIPTAKDSAVSVWTNSMLIFFLAYILVRN